jgi:DNA gyrase/topoisomerase IV subunit A
MDAFTMTTPLADETLRESFDRQTAEIANLKDQQDRAINMRDHWERKHNELQQKIANVKGYFFDLYSMNGSIDDEMKEIADLLDITLTKEIQGTATFEISWTASVPLDFDADDFEISFDVNCDTYEAEDFDWNEDNCDVSGEDV